MIMDTVEKFGLKKGDAVLLFVQMLLISIGFLASGYQLIFSIIQRLQWMSILSTIFVLLSFVALAVYGVIGYKKGDLAYSLSILPFLAAILVNTVLPGRSAPQIGLLAVLLMLSFAFLLRQEDTLFTRIMTYSMIAVSLCFSIFSAITANTEFLGPVDGSNAVTYIAMYYSIFTPVLISGTYALTYHIKLVRAK